MAETVAAPAVTDGTGGGGGRFSPGSWFPLPASRWCSGLDVMPFINIWWGLKSPRPLKADWLAAAGGAGGGGRLSRLLRFVGESSGGGAGGGWLGRLVGVPSPPEGGDMGFWEPAPIPREVGGWAGLVLGPV